MENLIEDFENNQFDVLKDDNRFIITQHSGFEIVGSSVEELALSFIKTNKKHNYQNCMMIWDIIKVYLTEDFYEKYKVDIEEIENSDNTQK